MLHWFLHYAKVSRGISRVAFEIQVLIASLKNHNEVCLHRLVKFLFLSLSISPPHDPIYLPDLVPHGNQREDCGDAARSSKKGNRMKGQMFWCRNHVDVVHCTTSHWRKRTFLDSTLQTAGRRDIVGEFVRVFGYRTSGIIEHAWGTADSKELHGQAQ